MDDRLHQIIEDYDDTLASDPDYIRHQDLCFTLCPVAFDVQVVTCGVVAREF